LENIMDLKALIAKMDHIEKKQILTESAVESVMLTETTETTVTDEEAKSLSIASEIMKEFGYELGEAELANPWQGKDPEKAAAWTALSPEDQKWLGGADPTDQYILMRAPNKGKPTQKVDPNSQQGKALAAQTAGMDDPASGVAGVQGGSQQDNMLAAQTADMDKEEPAATQTAQPAQAEPQKAQAAASVDPDKVKRFKELMAKAKAPAAVAGNQAAASQAGQYGTT